MRPMKKHPHTLDEIIEYKKRTRNARREWLEKRHRRNPHCDFCGLKTYFDPMAHQQNHIGDLQRYATLDHDVPTSRQGQDHKTNWKLSCATCNSLKSNMTGKEYMKFLDSEGVL